jgi:hypothetical protein
MERISELGTTLAVTSYRREGMLQLLVTANVPSSPILFTLMMEGTRSSETSVLTQATRSHNQEDGILHRHRCETFKSYLMLIACNEMSAPGLHGPDDATCGTYDTVYVNTLV